MAHMLLIQHISYKHVLDLLLLATSLCLLTASATFTRAACRDWLSIIPFLYIAGIAYIFAGLTFGYMYYSAIGTVISSHDVYAILQSAPAEAADFFRNTVYSKERAATAGTVFVASLAILYWFTRAYAPVEKKHDPPKWVALAIFTFLLSCTAIIFTQPINYAIKQYR